MKRKEAERAGKVAERWWRQLSPEDESRRGNRAARARLRRAETIYEALTDAAAIQLYGWVRKELGRERLSDSETGSVAVLAGVLAGIEGSAAAAFAEQLGRTPDGMRAGKEDRALMSPLRFGSLMRVREPEELLRHLRRAVALLNGKPFNVGQFAADILNWDDHTRRRWIFQYHQEPDAAPRPRDHASDENASEETPA